MGRDTGGLVSVVCGVGLGAVGSWRVPPTWRMCDYEGLPQRWGLVLVGSFRSVIVMSIVDTGLS